MRALGLLLVAVLLVATGCGGGKEATPATTQAPRPADRGREVIRALTNAAHAGDSEGVARLLSERAGRRPGTAHRLLRDLEPFGRGPYRVVVSERINDRFGLVAVARGRHALAVPLRLEDGEWKVDVGGPVSIEVLGPRPQAREEVLQIGVEVHGRGPGDAVLYLDGVTLIAKAYVGPAGATVFANLETALTSGRHVAAAFANRGGYAAARAWTFVAL